MLGYAHGMDYAVMPIYTIGHSSRPLQEFLDLLAESAIACVVDVRRLPGSRAFPQYDQAALSDSLLAHGIAYWHLPALCGRRNAGEVRELPTDHFWTNASFSRYAAWAQGTEFRRGLDAFVERASQERCALMCSEAVWWRCHRRIITDHLLARGCEVFHIMGPGKAVAATLTRGAKVQDGEVIYPARDVA